MKKKEKIKAVLPPPAPEYVFETQLCYLQRRSFSMEKSVMPFEESPAENQPIYSNDSSLIALCRSSKNKNKTKCKKQAIHLILCMDLWH